MQGQFNNPERFAELQEWLNIQGVTNLHGSRQHLRQCFSDRRLSWSNVQTRQIALNAVAIALLPANKAIAQQAVINCDNL
jgi:hypothetical protein